MRIWKLAALVLSVIALTPAVSAAADSTVDKTRLQAAMQQHIERQLVDGAILHLDTASGDVQTLYPTQAHPMILQMGEHFVLCSDLKDESGKSMPIDLYMAQKGKRFVVFHTEIDNRGPLKGLMKSGVVTRLR